YYRNAAVEPLQLTMGVVDRRHSVSVLLQPVLEPVEVSLVLTGSD
ncbi:MAG: hypothetical protein ACI9HA_001683, partial [Dinoroseobacter sp.]